MARSRNIKPSFFDNEDLAEIDFAARLLFIGLWTLADREGRIEYRPKKIKAQLFPYDPLDLPTLHRYLTVLARLRFISFYREADAVYIWVVKFKSHQSPHKTERESSLPGPSDRNLLTLQQVEELNGEITVKPPLNNGACTLGIGILIPESSIGIMNPEKPPPSGIVTAYTPEFEAFWSLAPRTNCSKREAAKSYQQAMKRGNTHDEIIRGIEAYRDFLAKSGSPAAHATTWLNNDRWTVDYAAAIAQRRETIRSSGRDYRDPATRARDIGEDIIARRRERWAAEDAAKRAATAGEPGGPGGTNPVALPDLRQPEDLRRQGGDDGVPGRHVPDGACRVSTQPDQGGVHRTRPPEA